MAEDAWTASLVADPADAGQLLIDEDGRVVYVSSSAAELIGHTSESLTGTSALDLVHPEDLVRTFQLNEDDLRLTGTTTGRWRIRHRGGGWCLVEAEVTATPAVTEAPGDRPAETGEDPVAGPPPARLVPGVGHRSVPALSVTVRPIPGSRPPGGIDAVVDGLAIWELDITRGVLRILGDPAAGGADSEHPVAFYQALIPPEDLDATPLGILRVVPDHGDVFTSEHRMVAGGRLRWYQHRVRVFRDPLGTPTHLRGTTTEVTEERRASQERDDRLLRYRRTVEAAGDAYLEVDGDGLVVGWSERAEDLFGWSATEALGRPVDHVVRPHDPERGEAVSTHLLAAPSAHPRPDPIELTVYGRHPWSLDLELVTAAVDQPAGPVHTALFRDISQRRTSEAELARRARRDELTGLPNRATAIDRLQNILAGLPGRGGDGGALVGVLSIDLDRFKLVNDSIGRRAGDRLLRRLAGRLHQAVTPADIIARVGGDEFMVIAIGHQAIPDLVDLGHSVAAVISEPIWMNGRDIRPTASVGVAVTRRAVSAETLVRDADTAMHQAKTRGGNRTELFTTAMRRTVLAYFQLEQELRTALQADQLRVAYQPIVELDGTVTGAEALVRWQHPSRGLLQPADFISLAEKTGLVSELGREVLHTACRQTAAWRRRLSPRFRVSVNVAAAQLDDPGFAELVERTLLETGLRPEGLCLEITETALMADTTTARSSLQRLGDLGCAVALDDFGTGYSPLLNLRYFPVDVIKLDRYFVAGLERDPKDQAIIGAVIDLAHALEMTTVAEGVETDHQREILARLGCDRAQGFLWHRPLTAEVIEGLLSETTRPPVRGADDVVSPRQLDGGRRHPPCRVVLVDDSPSERVMQRAMLEMSDDFEVVGEAEDSSTALDLIRRQRPDVVLLDLLLGREDSLPLIRTIARGFPDTQVVVCSGYLSPTMVAVATERGAVGSIEKSAVGAGLAQLLGDLLDDPVATRIGPARQS